MELYGSIQSISGSMTASVFTGSFKGDGSGLYNIQASGVTGLNLSQIATGSVTASVSPDGFNINSNTSITGSLRVNGTIIAEQIDVTIYSSSVLYQSGSTRFGDTLDDTHNITGSVNITGSISLNGQAIGTGKLDETVFNSYTASNNPRVSSLETSSGSLNSFSNSINSFTTSINSYTSSNNSRVSALEVSSGSLNNFTTSIGVIIKDRLNYENVVSSSTQISITGTTGYSTFSSSIATTDFLQEGRLSSLETTSGSLNTFSSSTLSKLTSIETSTSSLNSFSSSTNTRLNNLESASGSIRNDFNSYTSSNDSTNTTQNNRLNSLESTTGSLNTYTSSTNTRLGVIEGTTASLNSYTSSTNTRLGAIETATSSLNSFTSSINTTIKNKLNNDGVISGSVQIDITQTTNYTSFSASLATTDLNQTNKIGAIESTTASLNTFTSSTDGRLNSLESTSGSLNSYTSSNNTRLSVIESTTSSLNTFTSSANSRLNSLESASGSIRTDFNTFTSSASGRLNSLETASGSIRTDFNAFTSSYTTVSGSLDSRLDVLEAYSSSQQVPTASYSLRTTQTDVYCQNNSGYQINKGQVVRIVGAVGDNPLIATASYENDNNSANTLGIATENIANGSNGLVITEGVLLGVNTLGMSAGDIIFLGATGSFINTSPAAPLHGVRLGEVLRVQQNNGSIYVRIDNGIELNEVHDVTYTNISQGDLLVRNSGGIWSNSKSLNGNYSLTGSLNISGSQNIIGNQIITGSLYVTQDLIIAGSSSIQHISSSVVNIADNIITVNAQNPGIRFGGLAVIDSGSSPQVSGSMLFDSVNDQWLFVHQNQGTITSSVVLMGPESFNNLGGEIYLTQNRIPKGSGIEHLYDSNITDTGTKVSINSNTEVTGTFIATGTVYGTNITAIEATTSSLNSYTSSNNTTNTTQNSRLTSLESTTSSLNSFTSSAGGRLTSIETSTSSLNSFTSSASIRLNSIETSTGSLNSYTSSTNTRLSNIETSTGSLNSYTSSNNTRLNSIETSTGSLNSYTSSTNTRLNSIETSTGSLNSFTNSINTTIKNRLNAENVLSSSAQVVSALPAGTVSGSSQVLNNTTIHSGSFFNGITVVSGSGQISFNGITDKPTLVSGSSQITYGSISGIPAGIVSGSSQITYGSISGIPAGIVSGSSQISFGSISGIPSGLVSGSSQISFGSISNIPSGLVSGSSQITLSSTSGFSTYLDQAVKSGSTVTFNFVTANRFSQTAHSTTLSNSSYNSEAAVYANAAAGANIFPGYGFHKSGELGVFLYATNRSTLRLRGDDGGDYKLWHDGNDGSGSGLDADLLDGIDSSGFSRVKTGTLNLPQGSYNGWYRIARSSQVVSNFGGRGAFKIIVAQTGNNLGPAQVVIDGHKDWSNTVALGSVQDYNGASIFTQFRAATSGDYTYVEAYINWTSPAGGQDIAVYSFDNGHNGNSWDVLTGSITTGTASPSTTSTLSRITNTANYNGLAIGNNGVWTSGNDGSGSGLDADLLDGNHASAFLSSNTDSEQVVGCHDIFWNYGVGVIKSDARWNESGYDADLGTLHMYSTTAAGANYGRMGIALYNGSAYQYLTTKASTTGLFANNSLILTAGNYTSYAMAGAGYSANQNLNTSNSVTFAGITSNGSLSVSGVGTFTSSSDHQIALVSPDTWAGIQFDDTNSSPDYIWYHGGNQTFAIGGGGSNVSGKKLHVHGGMTIGTSLVSTASPSEGLTVAGVIKGASYFDAQASSGFRIRNSNDSANAGGWTRRGLWEGNANYDPGLWAETGYGLYFYSNGSANIRAYFDTSGHFLPGTNNTYDLGSSSLGWRNVYTNDLHLSNMNKPEGNDVDGTNGNWTIQEGAENLYIINNNNGKKFKISLEEIK